MPFLRFSLAAVPLIVPLGFACSIVASASRVRAQTSAISAPAKISFTYLDDEAEAGGFDVTATIGNLPITMIIAEQENGDGYLLRMNTAGSEFGLRRKGVFRALATSRVKPYAASLIVQRRGQRLRVINDNRVMLEVEDATWSEGQIGFTGSLK
ncbi:MAG: hypothetical protein JWN98_740, partial [Abditibacteriota bacterium]|nr:hypothetical protein [Abditibacteriota bacterium]